VREPIRESTSHHRIADIPKVEPEPMKPRHSERLNRRELQVEPAMSKPESNGVDRFPSSLFKGEQAPQESNGSNGGGRRTLDPTPAPTEIKRPITMPGKEAEKVPEASKATQILRRPEPTAAPTAESDADLNERERELLRQLHEELGKRELQTGREATQSAQNANYHRPVTAEWAANGTTNGSNGSANGSGLNGWPQ
jgi:hypothetical protein